MHTCRNYQPESRNQEWGQRVGQPAYTGLWDTSDQFFTTKDRLDTSGRHLLRTILRCIHISVLDESLVFYTPTEALLQRPSCTCQLLLAHLYRFIDSFLSHYPPTNCQPRFPLLKEMVHRTTIGKLLFTVAKSLTPHVHVLYHLK